MKGSGRTVAWAIPILQELVKRFESERYPRKPQCHRPTAVVILPTREVAHQVRDQLRCLAKNTDVRIGFFASEYQHYPQYQSLNLMEVDIAVGTISRFLDILNKDITTRVSWHDREANDLVERQMSISEFFDAVKYVVLEECNDMEHRARLQLQQFINASPPRKLWLVSSSQPVKKCDRMDDVHKVELTIRPEIDDFSNVEITFIRAGAPRPYGIVVSSALAEDNLRTVIIANEATDVEAIADQLEARSTTPSSSAHGHMTQHKRQASFRSFNAKETSIHVCTPVLTRGLRWIRRVIFLAPPNIKRADTDEPDQPNEQDIINDYLTIARQAGKSRPSQGRSRDLLPRAWGLGCCHGAHEHFHNHGCQIHTQ